MKTSSPIHFTLAELTPGTVFFYVPLNSARVHRATVNRLGNFSPGAAVAYVLDETIVVDGSSCFPREDTVVVYDRICANALRTEQDALSKLLEDMESDVKLLGRRRDTLEEKAREDRWEAMSETEREEQGY